MSREWLFIEANDVLMFRDSRPFAAGQNFVARSMFPPTPRTMQGVIRTHYLEMKGVDWRAYRDGRVDREILEKIGGPDDLGTLRLEGPFVARKKKEDGKIERLVRAPFDLLKRKGDRTDRSLILLSPEQEPSFKTNAPFEGWRALRGPDADYEEVSGWLTEAGLKAYLEGKTPKPEDILEDREVIVREERVGLGLDYGRRTGRQSLFYQAEFVRPCPGVGLLVGVNAGLFTAEKGVIAIGGEGRLGHYSRVKVSGAPNLPQVIDGSKQAKIVLLTPAYFSGGWHPINRDWSPWLGRGVRLVSLAIGKPLLISGWDLARGRARSLHHYLPAGSVFYFENAEPQQGKPFTETPPDSPDAGAMGFGAFAIGTWNYL